MKAPLIGEICPEAIWPVVPMPASVSLRPLSLPSLVTLTKRISPWRLVVMSGEDPAICPQIEKITGSSPVMTILSPS
jgi:hypothetical protein